MIVLEDRMRDTCGMPRARPPEDYVSRLIQDWRAERPDLPVDPVAIVYRVGRLAAHFAAEVDRVFAHSGISGADFMVLANLRRSGRPYRLSQRQLMDALSLTSGTVSVRIDRLADRGYVRRDPDPADRRGVLVALTRAGERIFDAVAPEHLANEARLVSALQPDEQAELARLLQVLLVEFEPPIDRPDDRLGLRAAPAHVGQQRRASVGLAPTVGLLVDGVRPGGPAARAGIQPGDLLMRVGGRDVRSLTCLASALDAAGATASVHVRRGEATITKRIALRCPS
jgi:DNA-binding MarR family transcriptional regulator